MKLGFPISTFNAHADLYKYGVRNCESTLIRGGLRLCGAPGWNLETGPLYTYKIVVNREKINERSEAFVLLKQKKFEQKKEPLTNVDVAIWTKLIDFKSPFLAGDLKPYR